MKLRAVPRLAAALACVAAVAASAGSTAFGANTVRHVSGYGSLTAPFSATVVAGPSRGHVYAGTLHLREAQSGGLTGTLQLRGGKVVRVAGELKGSLIAMRFDLGNGHSLVGTGLLSLDATLKKVTTGGTFSGPDEQSLGTWRVPGEVYEPVDSTGGCITGLLVDDPAAGKKCVTIYGVK